MNMPTNLKAIGMRGLQMRDAEMRDAEMRDEQMSPAMSPRLGGCVPSGIESPVGDAMKGAAVSPSMLLPLDYETGRHRPKPTLRRVVPTGHPSAGRGAAGFSIVEGLIAMLLLTILAIGIIPLFTQSRVNNVAARQLTDSSQLATAGLEAMSQLDFRADPLLLVNGGSNLRRIVQVLRGQDRAFEVVDSASFDLTEANGDSAADFETIARATFTAAEMAASDWIRVLHVRQYGTGALLDGTLTADEQLDGSALASALHFKVYEAIVIPSDNIQLLTQGRITARTIVSSSPGDQGNSSTVPAGGP